MTSTMRTAQGSEATTLDPFLVLYTPVTTDPHTPSTTSSSLLSSVSTTRSIFDDWRRHDYSTTPNYVSVMDPSLDLWCPTPKTKKTVDPSTGEVTEEDLFFRDRRTGRLWPTRCGRNNCSACAISNARRTAGAIALSSPTHTLTLTQAGDTCEAISKAMGKFTRTLRRNVEGVAFVWSAEANPSGTGSHVHAYLHTGSTTSIITHDAVNFARDNAGFGSRFDLEYISPPATTTYCAYPMKSLTSPTLRQPFLDLNGPEGRRTIVHSSRGSNGFWRDGPQGRPIKKDTAETLAYKRWQQKQGWWR